MFNRAIKEIPPELGGAMEITSYPRYDPTTGDMYSPQIDDLANPAPGKVVDLPGQKLVQTHPLAGGSYLQTVDLS